MRFLIPVLAILTLGLAGCSSYVSCAIDSLAAEPASKRVFIRDIPPPGKDSLRYAEYRAILRRAFVSKGFTVVDSQAEAESLVKFDYEITEPQLVGFRSSGYSASVYNAWNGRYEGSVNSSTASAVTVHGRFLSVVAYDRSGLKPIWSVQVGNTDESVDFRNKFPVLVLAASDWFGRANVRTTYRQVREGSADFLLYDGPVPEIGPWERPDSAR